MFLVLKKTRKKEKYLEVVAAKDKQEMSLNHCNNFIVFMTAPSAGQRSHTVV